MGTRPNISGSHSEISTRVPFVLLRLGWTGLEGRQVRILQLGLRHLGIEVQAAVVAEQKAVLERVREEVLGAARGAQPRQRGRLSAVGRPRMLNTRGVSSRADLNANNTRILVHVKRVFYCILFTDPPYLAS